MFRKLALAAVLTAITAPAVAGTPWLDAREQNQRQRIAKSDGIVTRAERVRLHRHADRMSTRIYRQKHDPQSR
ncbi:MAG: hypothetical protein WD944_02170 [Steroidobacteraceae bacterium]